MEFPYLRQVKRVLILTYYWPPSGGAGVQRWLKFVKYLRQFGWEPIVYTAENPEYPVLDNSLEKDIPQGIEIIKHPIWEPYQLYKQFIGQKKNERVVSGFLQEKKGKSFAQEMSLWLRGNIFIPDARCFWIKPSAKFLLNWLESNNVDAMVSTGPPHSMHLIARKIHQKKNIKWLADFRDPWTNIDFAGDLKMSAYAANRNAKLEKAVLDEADVITVVSDFMREEFVSKTKTPVHTITNGFDPDDFAISADKLRNDGKFSIVHTGSLNNRRNQPELWQAIKSLCEENQTFSNDCIIRLIGKNDISIRENIEALNLNSRTEWIDYLPHKEIIAEQKSAAVLFLSINNYGAEEKGFFSPKATLTGKMFEYLASGRPVLMVGPADGQAAEVIRDCKAGQVVPFGDLDAMKKAVWSLYEQWKSGDSGTTGGVDRFSRVTLTQELVRVLAAD